MTVKLAMVGLGRWAMFLGGALMETQGAELVTCFDSDSGSLANFADMFEVPPAGSLEEILLNPDIMGLVVATANHTHYEVVAKSLRAGKDVFVEKPLANSLAEARELVALARQCQRVLMTGHNSRRYPSVRKLKELICGGDIGEVRSAAAVFSWFNPGEVAGSSWRNDPEKCPGGPLLQLAVHHADNLRWLLGPIRRVQGSLRAPLPGGMVPPGGQLLLDFASGAMATIDSDYVTGPENFSITLRGDKGELYARGPSLVRIYDLQGKAQELNLGRDSSLAQEMAEFVRCIQTREHPETDGWAGLEALKVILAGLAAAEGGRPEELEEDKRD